MDAGNYTYRTRPAHDAALAWRPDVVVIALGTNDTKVDNIAKHPDDFLPSYRGLIDTTTAGGYGVLYGPNVTATGAVTTGDGKVTGTSRSNQPKGS